MLKSEAQKILTDAMMTLGLQDDRVNTIFRLMDALNYGHRDVTPMPEQPREVVSIKFIEELDTERQRHAFRDWWEQKTHTSHPMNVAYGMFIEHIKAKNESVIEFDQLKAERDLIKEWANRIAYKVSDITGTDIGVEELGDNPWLNAVDALTEWATRPTTLKVTKATPTPTAWLSVLSSGNERVSTSLDIAKDSAGVDGVVFGLWKAEDIDTGGRNPKAWYAYQGEVSYLIQDLEAGVRRYPNVHLWIPLYLDWEAFHYCFEMYGKRA